VSPGRKPLRDRKFADSSLEGTGFELPVPLKFCLHAVARLPMPPRRRVTSIGWAAMPPRAPRSPYGGTEGANPVPSSQESVS
jgi:hypothetical protein